MPRFASSLSGSHVLITGGNKGIGRVMVESFLAEGANVSYCGRSVRGDEFADFRDAIDGARAVGKKLDIADRSALRDWVESSAKAFGRLDVVVANASPQVKQPTEDDWMRSFEANVLGLTALIDTAIPHLASAGGKGSIVVMGSVAGFETRYALPTGPYPTMKRAQATLAKNYSRSLAPRGIRINTLVSGAVETPDTTLPDGTVEKSTWHAKMEEDPAFFDALFEQIPMGRAARAQETVNAVIFLSSPLSSYMTGSVLVADGGIMMGC